jgi:hypothetical protein
MGVKDIIFGGSHSFIITSKILITNKIENEKIYFCGSLYNDVGFQNFTEMFVDLKIINISSGYNHSIAFSSFKFFNNQVIKFIHLEKMKMVNLV